MRSGLVNVLVRHLRRSAGEPEPRCADADLVRRFATGRDSEAFAELVHRHGPLVWGVCRRSLANRTDAEDAFQATFLVFAKNAASIRKPEALGAWLHGVAHRVAQRTRVRGESLQTDPVSPAPSGLDSLTVRELLAALDDELAALPDKYRGPIVLCFLQERTQDDAAKRLGVSLSTLKRRLDTGRELLRGRLTRRGVELPAALLAAGLGGGAVPTALAKATVRAATVGGAGVVSANVLTITEGVIRTMWETKLRTWVAGVLMATTAAGGTGYFAYTGYGQTGADRKSANPPAAKKIDPNERIRLAELEVAKSEVEIAESMLVHAQKSLERLRKAAETGVVTAAEMSQAESEVQKAKGQMIRARAQYEIALARLDAERQKGATEEDHRRHEAERKEFAARDYERAIAVQAVSPEIQKLRAEKVKVAQAVMESMAQGLKQGAIGQGEAMAYLEAFCTHSKQLLAAERELNSTPQAQLKAAQGHLARMKELDSYTQKRAGGVIRIETGRAVTFCRIEAEIWVKEAEAGAASGGDPRIERPRPQGGAGEDAKAHFERTDTAQLRVDVLNKRLLQLEHEAKLSRDEAERARAEVNAERKRVEVLMARVVELTRLLKNKSDKSPDDPKN